MPDQKRVRRITQKQEKGTAERFGGQQQPGSGSHWARRHDVRTDALLIENKTRTKPGAKQITLLDADLRSVVTKALLEGRTGILQFELAGHRYVVIEEADFHEGWHPGGAGTDRQREGEVSGAGS